MQWKAVRMLQSAKLVHGDPRHKRSKKAQPAPPWQSAPVQRHHCSKHSLSDMADTSSWMARMSLASRVRYWQRRSSCCRTMAILRDRLCRQLITDGSALACREHQQHWATGTQNCRGDGEQANGLPLRPKISLSAGKRAAFSLLQPTEAQRCPNVIWISKLVEMHQRNTTPGEG